MCVAFCPDVCNCYVLFILFTQTGKADSLRSVTSGTDAAVAADRVLTDLSVAAHVASIVALIDV